MKYFLVANKLIRTFEQFKRFEALTIHLAATIFNFLNVIEDMNEA
ncbi:hypothetical protein Plhal304r1_c029g0096041 [Plasmopara halstedii]